MRERSARLNYKGVANGVVADQSCLRYPDAAPADLIKASNEIPEEQFEVLLALLVRGKFLNPSRWNLTGPTPTLRRILESEKLRTQILNREFFDPDAKAC